MRWEMVENEKTKIKFRLEWKKKWVFRGVNMSHLLYLYNVSIHEIHFFFFFLLILSFYYPFTARFKQVHLGK